MTYRKMIKTPAAVVLLVVCLGAVASTAQADTPSTATQNSSDSGAQQAKDALARLSTLYDKVTDLSYRATITAYGPAPLFGQPQPTQSLSIIAQAEKPNKCNVKAMDGRKLRQFIFSNGTQAYKYDDGVKLYTQFNAPKTGLDLPTLHTTGIEQTEEFGTAFDTRMFLSDYPYDLTYSSDAGSDVHFASADQKMGAQAVLAITEWTGDENGNVTTLHITVNKDTGLPIHVGEEVTSAGRTNTVFKEDFESFTVGNVLADAGAYLWQPPVGAVIGWVSNQ